ncbi:V-type proton ATPase subunit G 1 [Sigmodon hispidus]
MFKRQIILQKILWECAQRQEELFSAKSFRSSGESVAGHAAAAAGREAGGGEGVQAHKRKNRRLKQAEEEAQAETEQYRLQREREFKAKEAAALGSHGSCSSEMEKETQEKMTVLQNYFQQNRDEVLETSWPLCVTFGQKSMKTTA